MSARGRIGTMTRRPSFKDGTVPVATSAYAVDLEMRRMVAASVTVSVKA
jgi:hypothetical protein